MKKKNWTQIEAENNPVLSLEKIALGQIKYPE
jgi:hypothetical protein